MYHALSSEGGFLPLAFRKMLLYLQHQRGDLMVLAID